MAPNKCNKTAGDSRSLRERNERSKQERREGGRYRREGLRCQYEAQWKSRSSREEQGSYIRDRSSDSKRDRQTKKHTSFQRELVSQSRLRSRDEGASERTVGTEDKKEMSWAEMIEEEDRKKELAEREYEADRKLELARSSRSSTPSSEGSCKVPWNPDEIETDPVVLSRRQKQLEYGKNTIAYDNYIAAVPKDKRTLYHPVTPDKYMKCSRRRFDGLVKSWRKQLHIWDLPAQNNEKEEEGLDLDMTGTFLDISFETASSTVSEDNAELDVCPASDTVETSVDSETGNQHLVPSDSLP